MTFTIVVKARNLVEFEWILLILRLRFVDVEFALEFINVDVDILLL